MAQASRLARLAELPWGLGECRCAGSFGRPRPKCQPAPQELALQAHETETPLIMEQTVFTLAWKIFSACFFFLLIFKVVTVD